MENAQDMEQLLRTILPYTEIVGQQQLKLALELAFISSRIGGVLISGQRGTAKSTTVRAFASMMYQKLPVTIPINATEDRVVGSWNIQKLMDDSKLTRQKGLIEDAHNKILYIDEVNLLDDHIVNILLDVTSTGKLVIQRETINQTLDINFILVGTMNPEEGGLRPQLRDRFGLMVRIASLTSQEERRNILKTILAFDQALQQENQKEEAPFLQEARKKTRLYKASLEQARAILPEVIIPEDVIDACATITEQLKVEGHRADYLLALAAQALAAREGRRTTTKGDVLQVAELVLQHRVSDADQLNNFSWHDAYGQHIAEIIGQVEHIEQYSR